MFDVDLVAVIGNIICCISVDRATRQTCKGATVIPSFKTKKEKQKKVVKLAYFWHSNKKEEPGFEHISLKIAFKLFVKLWNLKAKASVHVKTIKQIKWLLHFSYCLWPPHCALTPQSENDWVMSLCLLIWLFLKVTILSVPNHSLLTRIFARVTHLMQGNICQAWDTVMQDRYDDIGEDRVYFI